MMRRSSLLTAGARVVLCALGASACGGSHRSAPAVTSAQVVIVTSTASSSAAPTTPLAATTTSPSPAPTTSTTAAPTTTTTIRAATRDELAVRAAWKGWLAASEACDVDPKGCDRAGLANYMAGSSLTNKLLATDTLISKGWGVREGPGGIDDRYKIESVTSTEGQAIVQYCQFDEGVTVDPGAGPGGADVIINDTVASRRIRTVFTRPDGVWKVTGSGGNHQEEGRALWDSCVAG